MEPDSIGPSNMFFIFAGLSFGGAIYSFFFIKETKDLTDKAKRLLFVPKKYMKEFLGKGDIID